MVQPETRADQVCELIDTQSTPQRSAQPPRANPDHEILQCNRSDDPDQDRFTFVFDGGGETEHCDHPDR